MRASWKLRCNRRSPRHPATMRARSKPYAATTRRLRWRRATSTSTTRCRHGTMAANPPDGPHPASQGAERFPLAARALRVPAARLPAPALAAGPRGRAGARSTARAVAGTRTPNNWALYAFLFLLPLQNVHTGYLPNLGGGLNFLNIGFGLSLLG